MKLDKALYQTAFNELKKAVEALENVHKLQRPLQKSRIHSEGEFIKLNNDYNKIHGEDSFMGTVEHDVFVDVLSKLEYLSEGKILKIKDSLEEIKDVFEDLAKAADKLG